MNEEPVKIQDLSFMKELRIFPVISWGAELLVQGYLMRRNILTFKSPPRNEGYDLICIHPEPSKQTKTVKVQVKSRYATDSPAWFLVKEKAFPAFDFLILAVLNIGDFSKKKIITDPFQGLKPPEFFTFPISVIKDHHRKRSDWEGVRYGQIPDLDRYKNELGFELIAEELGIEYPSREVRKKVI